MSEPRQFIPGRVPTPPVIDPQGERTLAGWLERGIELDAQGRVNEAILAFQQGLESYPKAVPLWSNLGLCLRKEGRLSEAITALEYAVAGKPDASYAWLNLATVCGAAGVTERALQSAERVVAIAPGKSTSWGVYGNCLRDAGRIEEAIRAYDKGLQIEPAHPSLRWNQSETLLLGEQWARGFEQYEWRYRRPGYFPAWWGRKLWRGRKLSGTLLLHTEQGFGDAIQFARFVREARERVGCIVVRCHRRLAHFFRGVEGVDRVVTKEEPLPPCDRQCFVMSLPALLQLEGVPAEPARVVLPGGTVPLALRNRVKPGQIRVGVAWQGNPKFGRDHLRSIPLQAYAPFAKVAGVQLFSLQKHHGREQIAECGFQIHDLDSELDGGSHAFVDTAAAIQNLDCLIVSDSSLAHLAGSMGCKVLLLIPKSPDWRWGLSSTTSSWYPSMRLFRQTRMGDWSEPVETITHVLEALVFRSRWGGVHERNRPVRDGLVGVCGNA